MPRSRCRRNLSLERLEARQVLSSGGPTAEAQYMLELINEARTNPAEAAQRVTSHLDGETQATLAYYGTNLDQARHDIASAPAKPPVAWNPVLTQTATGQSWDQNSLGQQTHVGADGADLTTRLSRAGYGNRSSSGENAFAYAKSVDQAMQAFLLDWGVPSKGHFKNLLQPDTPTGQAYRDVGIGIVQTSRPGFGPEVITQDFGAQNGEKAQLLGVAYNDRDGNHFYTPGEGRGDVTIEARNLDNGQTQSVQTWDSGGYQMPLDQGNYAVTARVNGQPVGGQKVHVGTDNVKVDFDLNQPYSAPVAPPAQPTPPPPPPVQHQAPPPVVQQAPPPAQPQAQPHIQAQSQQPQYTNPTFSESWITSWTSWKAATRP